MGILGVASLSRWHYHVVSQWACSAVQTEPSLEAYMKVPFSPPNYTSIAILCKHFSWICAYCNNKARHPRWGGELATRLRLCHACEPVYLPKISLDRIGSIFHFVPGSSITPLLKLLDPFQKAVTTKSVIRQNRTVENVICNRYYLWDEIQHLISEGSSESEAPLRLRMVRY